LPAGEFGCTELHDAVFLHMKCTSEPGTHRMMRQLDVESRYEAVQTIFDRGYS
jgi:hypothetical protein